MAVIYSRIAMLSPVKRTIQQFKVNHVKEIKTPLQGLGGGV